VLGSAICNQVELWTRGVGARGPVALCLPQGAARRWHIILGAVELVRLFP
jgi:hypothetical protein